VTTFNALEWAALRAIFAETPELAPLLTAQAEQATVTKRENTGGGFFTDISVAGDWEPIRSKSPLGDNVFARVEGLEHGLGLLVFLEEGRLHLLEGYSVAGEDTQPLAFESVAFEITDTPGGD